MLVPTKAALFTKLESEILGEAFAKHELELGEKRVKEWGLVPVYMNNALKGMERARMRSRGAVLGSFSQW